MLTLPPDYFSQQSNASRVLDTGNFRPTIGPGFTTPDLDALHANTLRSRYAHSAFIEAQRAQDNLDNQLLQTATPDELSNLFGQPRNEREARIQQIVQGDYNAKERGAQLIPTWRTQQAYNKGNLENQHLANQIADEQLNRQYVPKKFNLDLQQFGLEKDKFGNVKDYQGKELAQKDRQFNLSNQLAKDRFARETATSNRADQRLTNQDFSNAQKAVIDGKISADDVISATPGLSTAQQTLLRAHESNARANADQAARMAEGYNQNLRNSIPQTVAPTPHWYGNSGGYIPTEEEKAAARQREIDKFQHDSTARKQIFYDPETGTFQPLLRFGASTSSGNSGYADPVPPQYRWGNQIAGGMTGAMDTPSGAFPDESSSPYFRAPVAQPSASGGLMEGPDGYLYRMVNGVPQRTNLRRQR